MKSSSKKRPRLFSKSTIFQIAVLILAVALLYPQIKTLLSNRQILGSLNFGSLVLAFSLIIIANLFSAATYVVLTPSRLPFWRTVIAQQATGFTNRILPNGLGGIGLNTFYIAKNSGISKTSAATIAAANNFVGFIAFNLCLILSILSSSGGKYNLSSTISGGKVLFGIAILFVVLIFLLCINKVRSRILRSAVEAASTLKKLIGRPLALLLAVLLSMCITFCYIGSLWLCITSAGAHISLLATITVFAVGNVTLAASPTPGGIGPTELVMSRALILASVEASLALAIIFAFRLVAYWLPVIPGYIAFRYLSERKYL